VNGASRRSRRLLDDGPGIDEQKATLDERHADRVSGSRQDPRVRLARHAHSLGGCILIQPLDIGQADGFEAVLADAHRVHPPDRGTGRAKSPALDRATHAAGKRRARHR